MSPSKYPVLAFVFAATFFAGVLPAEAAPLSIFNGKYTGVLVIAQGTAPRAVASANPTVRAGGRSGKIIIKGTLNNTGFTQTISLMPGGKATISSLLPGGSGDFQASASGTYQIRGRQVLVTAPISTAFLAGTLSITIAFTNSGHALSINSALRFTNGVQDVYVTVVGS